jgi:hypothetical protein
MKYKIINTFYIWATNDILKKFVINARHFKVYNYNKNLPSFFFVI